MEAFAILILAGELFTQAGFSQRDVADRPQQGPVPRGELARPLPFLFPRRLCNPIACTQTGLHAVRP